MFSLFGCAGLRKTDKITLLVATVGTKPFEDRVELFSLDGKRTETLLAPSSEVSYPFASGCRLDRLAVVAHKITKGVSPIAFEQLFIYAATTNKWQPITSPDASAGMAEQSGDGKWLAFTRADGNPPRGYHVVVRDLSTGNEISLPVRHEKGWHSYPTWGKDEEFAFLEFYWRGGGLHSNLLIANVSQAVPTVLIADEDVSSARFSEDGSQLAFWSRNGLEVVDFPKAEHRKVVTRVPTGYSVVGGPLEWRQGHLIFALTNRATKKYEVWETTLSDGTSSKLMTVVGRVTALYLLQRS
jgi:hypothetical protein